MNTSFNNEQGRTVNGSNITKFEEEKSNRKKKTNIEKRISNNPTTTIELQYPWGFG